MKRRFIPLLTLALALLLAGGAMANQRVQGQTVDTVVRVIPASKTLAIGEVFTVAIQVEDVLDLYGADIQLAFDPTAFEVVGEVITIRSDFLQPQSVAKKVVDNTAGTIWYAVSQVNPTEPVSGSGILFEFDLRAKKAGTTQVTITNHQLAAIGGEAIENIAYDAVYSIAGGTAQYLIYLPLIIR